MSKGIFGNYLFDDPAAYQQALARWEAGGRKGDPPGFSGAMTVQQNLNNAGFSPEIANAAFWADAAKAGAQAPLRGNPYQTSIADQSRPAQLALLEQMQQQMQGPSIAGMQGQRAMAQGGQMALRNAAMGAPGRAGMVGAAQGSAGMAGDVGQARLAEVMRAQAGMGGLAGGLRGADLRSAQEQMGAGLGMLGADLNRRQGFAALGARQASGEDAARTEMYKAAQRGWLQQREKDIGALKGALGPLGTAVTGFLK